MKNLGIRKLLLLGAAGLLLAAGPAMAQSATNFPGNVPDNFRLRLGGIFASLSSDIKLTAEGSDGTNVDFPGLGLTPDSKNTFRGDGYWNFAGRSYLDFGFVDYSSDGSKTISKDITWDGVVYKAGATVAGENESRFIYAAYRYGIVKNEAVHFGLSLGVSYTTLRASLSANANVTKPDGTVIAGGATKEREINAPVPLLGAELEFRIAGPVTIGARFRGVGLNIDPWSGSWVEATGMINWYFSRNFGVGGAYEYQKILVEKETTGHDFRFEQKFEGPRAFILITF